MFLFDKTEVLHSLGPSIKNLHIIFAIFWPCATMNTFKQYNDFLKTTFNLAPTSFHTYFMNAGHINTRYWSDFIIDHSLTFPRFLYEARVLWMLKADGVSFSRNIFFWQNLSQKYTKWSQNRVFYNFWRILLHVIAKNAAF